jgi:hypothetical protein
MTITLNVWLSNNCQTIVHALLVDPDLGMHKIAVRCIPSECIACVEQLQHQWLPGESAEEQPRYSRNSRCILFQIFDGLNDWQIICLSL